MPRAKAVVIESRRGPVRMRLHGSDGARALVQSRADAKLHSALLEEHRAGAPVAVVDGAGKTTRPAAEWLTDHGR